MRPSNPIMSRAYQTKIKLIGKLFEGTAFQIGFNIKNTRNAAAGQYNDSPALILIHSATSLLRCPSYRSTCSQLI